MIKNSIRLSVLAFSILSVLPDSFSQTTVAGIWERGSKSTKARATKSPLILDGVFNEVAWSHPDVGYNSTTSEFPNAIDNKVSKTNLASDKDANMPPDAAFVGNGSFGLLWDDTYLYIGIVLKNPKKIEDFTWPVQYHLSGSEIYIASDNNKRSVHPSITSNFPRAYSATDFQLILGYTAANLNKLFSATAGNAVTGQTSFEVVDSKFSGDNVDGFVKRVGDNVYIEAAIKWAPLNAPLVDIITGILPDEYKIREGRVVGIDVSHNIPVDAEPAKNADGKYNGRAGFKYWNACCIDRNWTESIAFGVATLTGTTGADPLKDINFNPSTISITDGSVVSLSADVDPIEADKRLRYEVISSDPSRPTLIVNNIGQITPLNNGSATIIGYSLSSVFATSGFVKSVTSATVNVSGMTALESISINDSSVTKNWKDLQLTVSHQPSQAPNLVTWEIIENNNLGSINSLTGLLFSYPLVENGSITVKATSVADPSKTATKVIPYNNLVVLTANNVTINGIGFKPCGGNTARNITFSGYTSNSTRIQLFAQYTSPYNCEPQVVDSRYLNYVGLQAASDAPLFSNLGKVTKTGTTSYFEPASANANARLRLSYSLSPNVSVTSSVAMRQSMTVCTTPSVPCVNGTTPGSVFATLDNSPVSIYPNPSTGDFSVKFDLAKGTDVTVSVLNAVGNTVSTSKQAVGAGVSEIAVSGATLPKGVYFVKVSTANGQTAVKKLLIQ